METRKAFHISPVYVTWSEQEYLYYFLNQQLSEITMHIQHEEAIHSRLYMETS